MKTTRPPQFEYSSMNPPPPPGSLQKVGGWIKFFQNLFILVSAVSLFTFVYWVIDSRESQVVSSQPIGQFISMSGPGGLQNHVVIETDQGSYPIIDAPAISKGTNLVLEVRQSGQRYVCDVTRDLCIKTTATEFKRSVPATTSPKTAVPVPDSGL